MLGGDDNNPSTAENVVSAAELATNVVGGMHPLGTAASVALSGVSGKLSGRREYEQIASIFGERELRIAKHNPAIKQELKNMDERWKGSMWESALTMGAGVGAGALLGAPLGGLLGNFVIPVPIIGSITGLGVGTLVCSIAGAMIASKIYHSFEEEQAKDPLVITAKIVQMQEAGKPISPVVVFAALASNISGEAGKHIDDLLEKYTGTKYFSEALGNPKTIAGLTAMMNDPSVNDIIRAQVQMPHDAQNPRKPVALQYAELMASGQLKARDLLKAGAGMYAQQRDEATVAEQGHGGDVAPEKPELPTRSRQIPTRSA